MLLIFSSLATMFLNTFSTISLDGALFKSWISVLFISSGWNSPKVLVLLYSDTNFVFASEIEEFPKSILKLNS